MIIRPESRHDQKEIEQLTYLAFKNHPHHDIGAEPTEQIIINKLREDNALTLSLVAEDSHRILGHIAFSPITLNDQPTQWVGLGPMSVHPEYQRKGIGRSLIQQAFPLLQEMNVEGIVVLGDPNYYSRFGFDPHKELIFPDVPQEYFMAKSITEHCLIPSGIVKYHCSFYE